MRKRPVRHELGEPMIKPKRGRPRSAKPPRPRKFRKDRSVRGRAYVAICISTPVDELAAIDASARDGQMARSAWLRRADHARLEWLADLRQVNREREEHDQGKVFERAIAAVLRERFPAATARRSSQAERAHQSDVYLAGEPTLERLWLELQDARRLTPLAKLPQAERDIEVHHDYPNAIRFPVVVWHELGARTIHVTTRLWVVDRLRGRAIGVAETKPPRFELPIDLAFPVTSELPAFLDLVASAVSP